MIINMILHGEGMSITMKVKKDFCYNLEANTFITRF